MNYDDTAAKLANTKKQPPVKGAAAEINRLHRECCEGMRTTLEKAIEIGKRLAAQKKECGHGKWEAWVKANLTFSVSLAWRYMRCHENRANLAAVQDLTIAEFARLTDAPAEETKVKTLALQVVEPAPAAAQAVEPPPPALAKVVSAPGPKPMSEATHRDRIRENLTQACFHAWEIGLSDDELVGMLRALLANDQAKLLFAAVFGTRKDGDNH